MARPKAKELTQRELEIMHAFWDLGELTVTEVRDTVAKRGRDLAYTTVATLVRILHEKGFLKQTSDERPFKFVSCRSFDDVSGNMLTDLLKRVFHGSREQLLVRLMEQQELTSEERSRLVDILREQENE